MKKRILALGLALCLTAGLAACGGGDAGDVQPAPDPSESAVVTPEETVEPSATPIPDGGTPTLPDNTDAPGALCPDGDAPSAEPTPTDAPAPSATPWPVVSEPTAPPSEEPSEPPAKALSADSVYATWTSSGAGSGFIDMSDYVSDYYATLNLGDVESFAFYQPDMSSSLQELFLAKAKSGKLSQVKAAVQDRLEGLREQAEFYPGTSEYVDAAKVETVGDWVVLTAFPQASQLVKILKDAAN